jgi:hypothetical protein
VSVNNTYNTPSKHCRGEYRCRPGDRNRRGGSTNNGSSFAHNSSDTLHFNGFTRPTLRRRRRPASEVVIPPRFDSRPKVPADFEITS